MTDVEDRKIDTTIRQKKQGYSTPRRLRNAKIAQGNTIDLGGWEIVSGDILQSAADANGFRIQLKSSTGEISFGGGVTIKNTATPFSGVGSMTIEHDTGAIFLEIGGSGEGLGTRYAILGTPSVYVIVVDNDDGSYAIKMVGLPTSDPGVTNQIWNDGGTLKIS